MKHRCPICKSPTDSDTNAEFPFCSERCRERDLGNWASEKYVVSEPVFDLDELEADKNPANKEKIEEEDEDFKGFPKPDDTIH
ncbi:MAG: DNA gyrase inhibitor YacG [Candidatus Acidiferrum sp.]